VANGALTMTLIDGGSRWTALVARVADCIRMAHAAEAMIQQANKDSADLKEPIAAAGHDVSAVFEAACELLYSATSEALSKTAST
jgi:hypothetical protein